MPELNKKGHIYLVGFMGSGKTSVGPILASSLGLPFLDLDSLVEERCAMSIPEVFSQFGEDFFREQEHFVLVEVARLHPPSVVATGGGVVMREDNWKTMINSGTVVHLYAPLEVLWERVSSTAHRPLARDYSGFQDLWRRRLPLYRKAQIEIDSFAKTPEEVAMEVLSALGFAQKKEA